MQIILKRDIMGLGEEGDVRDVAPGYGRNWLLPKGFAMLKTAGNLKWLERHQVEIDKRKEEKSFEAKSVAEKLVAVSVTIKAKVSGSNKLYGSIHAHQISEALLTQGIELDHRKLEITHPIKTVGEHDVLVKIYEGVQATIKVIVKSVEEDGNDPTIKSETPIAEAPVAETTEVAKSKDNEEVKTDDSSSEEAVETENSNSKTEVAPEENSDQKVAE